jgi:glucosamine--fructose-6-phosphate aminotransferase (isomerizing)
VTILEAGETITLGSTMAAEIAEQPSVYRRILTDGRSEISRVAAAIEGRRPRFVLFLARGTSDHAALYAKYLVETRLGLPAGLMSPSSSTIYQSHQALEGVLLVAISQSGSSPDLVQPAERARAQGAITVAVTNAPNSPLASVCEFHIDILAGEEVAVAATKSYTAELLTLYLLVEYMAGRDGVEADDLPSRSQLVLGREPEVWQIATRYRFAEQILVTSRGYNLSSALETALKIVETTRIPSYGFSGADLMHGPNAMVDRGFPVIAIVPYGETATAMRPVLEELQGRGADVLLVGDGEAPLMSGLRLDIGSLGPEPLSPLLMILPMQQFALHLARQRGYNPDSPEGLNKVTRTL